MGSLLRAAALRGYPELVRQLGADPAVYLRRFGLPIGAELEPDGFIPFHAYTDLLETTADELGCPDFGLRLIPFRGLDFAGPVAVIARNSSTALDSLHAAAHFMHVHTPAVRLTIDSTPAYLRVIYETNEPVRVYPLQAIEASIGSTVRFARHLILEPLTPITVSLTHVQNSPDASYLDAYGSPTRFEQDWCGLKLPQEVAAMRVRGADPETRRIVGKYLEANHLPASAPLIDRVAERVRNLLATGLCSVETVADQLAIHPRTLQRALAAVGLSCHDVIDRERRARAERLLSVPGLPLSQVAGMLGFSEQSALNRACRRWFDMTPLQYRASLTLGGDRA